MTHHTLDYARRIRERGYRLTPQRQLILDAVCACQRHCTIDEIYEYVRARIPTISLATIYRTLDFLCEMRLVVAASLGGRQVVYEIAGTQPHHHLVCRNCGATYEIGDDLMQAFFRQIEAQRDFRVDMDHVALFGLCSHCREEG